MRDEEQEDGSALDRPPTTVDERIHEALERAAHLFTLLVTAILLVFVGVALVGVVTTVWQPLVHEHDFVTGTLDGLDSAFLAIILLEVVHTTLSRAPVTQQVEQFVAIGITVGVRSGLEAAVRARVSGSAALDLSLVLNAVAVLLLVLAWWLVRQRIHSD